MLCTIQMAQIVALAPSRVHISMTRRPSRKATMESMWSRRSERSISYWLMWQANRQGKPLELYGLYNAMTHLLLTRYMRRKAFLKQRQFNRFAAFMISLTKQYNVIRLGMMLVGLGGNNGTTVMGGLIANKMNMSWNTKVRHYYHSCRRASPFPTYTHTHTHTRVYLPYKFSTINMQG